MAEANLIPGATQVFADVLEGGSVKKLFDNMQKGKYDLQDIVKVLDSLESKLKKDVLSKMFSKPSVAMNDFRTALTRFWEEVNAAGGSDMMIGVLTAMADALKGATKWMKDNKETIDSWVKGVKVMLTVLAKLAPILLTIWGIRKVFGLLDRGIPNTPAGNRLRRRRTSRRRRIITTILDGGLDISTLLLGGGGRFRPMVFAKKLFSWVKAGIKMLARSWPLLVAILLQDIYTAMTGGQSVIGGALTSDNPIAKWVSRAVLGVFQIGKSLFVTGFSLFDLLFGSDSWTDKWKMFKDVWKENWGETGDWLSKYFGEVWDKVADSLLSAFSGAIDYLKYFFSTIGSNLKAVAMNVKRAVTGDWESFETLKDPLSLTDYRNTRNKENAVANLQWAQNSQPFSTSNPSMLLPRQHVPTTQTFSLVINAEGTPDAIKSVATQAFADMMSSSILGVSANYQGGK